ncbi:Chsy1 [Symbiodinium natans]|uniref:Chsy1 protein n=1 Tax=Symbiodinium natans TaxID=878477 RepID=A0A812T2R1_9DINO|nr:Chsy1 [Symbiodinium natans]
MTDIMIGQAFGRSKELRSSVRDLQRQMKQAGATNLAQRAGDCYRRMPGLVLTQDQCLVDGGIGGPLWRALSDASFNECFLSGWDDGTLLTPWHLVQAPALSAAMALLDESAEHRSRVGPEPSHGVEGARKSKFTFFPFKKTRSGLLQKSPCPKKNLVLAGLLKLARGGWAALGRCSRQRPGEGLITVVTSGLWEYQQRVLWAKQTWAHDWPEILFVAGASAGNISLGVEALPCDDDEEKGVCCKTILGLKLALQRFPHAQWIVRAVDDTVVFPNQLAAELQVFNAEQFVYVGAPSVTLLCHMAKYAKQCGELHAGGGGGIVLSRPLAEFLLNLEDLFLNVCRHDDAFLGHLLRYVLDVHVMALPGVLQEPRFEQLRWSGPGLPPRCTLPLPPPVYSPMEDWGPVQPFAPMDATRLSLVHADLATWPVLAALPELVDAAAKLGLHLLVYADSQGHRIVYPHFRGATTFAVCSYAHEDRLMSFQAAAATHHF